MRNVFYCCDEQFDISEDVETSEPGDVTGDAHDHRDDDDQEHDTGVAETANRDSLLSSVKVETLETRDTRG